MKHNAIIRDIVLTKNFSSIKKDHDISRKELLSHMISRPGENYDQFWCDKAQELLEKIFKHISDDDDFTILDIVEFLSKPETELLTFAELTNSPQNSSILTVLQNYIDAVSTMSNKTLN